jgi:hypothetical protein
VLHKKETFSWSSSCEEAFFTLKHSLMQAPILRFPDYNQKFILQTDVSDVGIAAVLHQERGKDKWVIAYASRSLSKHEKNYSTLEKEALAIVWSVEKYHAYLFGRKFVILSDHQPLKWLYSVNEPKGRISIWVMKLSQYGFDIMHVKGKMNVVADTLSRDIGCVS